MNRLLLGFKALRELGLRQLSLYALYQFGLRCGHYHRVTPIPVQHGRVYPYSLQPVLRLPAPAQVKAVLGEQDLTALIRDADEIVAGQVRLFGSDPVPLVLVPPGPLRHWTKVERDSHDLGDLKFIWEPARFGWAFTLGRAYWLTQDERYPEACWQYIEAFLEANSPYLGPNWASAQEVALRLCALTFTAQVFAGSPHSTPARMSRLAESVAHHAQRIPPTLVYARAQNNNHLISEALGLFTAAAALPQHPHTHRWRQMGWHWLNQAFQRQIAPDGAYCQHSTNYHRLMLQAALWADAVQRATYPQQPFPALTLSRLQAAVTWLLALLDPQSGQVPNLGPNDGALIFPLASGSFADYRPLLQAASLAFLSQPAMPSGPWDELNLWHALPPTLPSASDSRPAAQLTHPSQTVLQGAGTSWAYLRTAHFTSRPGHADQLHLDLWWRGLNICRDAGTYRYTAEPPWDNALTSTFVHNTLSVDGREQMTRAGRYLYLDWAQAGSVGRSYAPDGSWEQLHASHNGYRKMDLTHHRQVTAYRDGRWLVEDALTGPKRGKSHTARLHWLLPDWPWDVDISPRCLNLHLASPAGVIELIIQTDTSIELRCAVVKGGQLLLGEGPIAPTWGWTSATYGDKMPALAIIVQIRGPLPLRITSQWNLPDETS